MERPRRRVFSFFDFRSSFPVFPTSLKLRAKKKTRCDFFSFRDFSSRKYFVLYENACSLWPLWRAESQIPKFAAGCPASRAASWAVATCKAETPDAGSWREGLSGEESAFFFLWMCCLRLLPLSFFPRRGRAKNTEKCVRTRHQGSRALIRDRFYLSSQTRLKKERCISASGSAKDVSTYLTPNVAWRWSQKHVLPTDFQIVSGNLYFAKRQ